ncbi:hypothetical protein QF002_001451 [Paraburkholderia youngii]
MPECRHALPAISLALEGTRPCCVMVLVWGRHFAEGGG